MNYLDWAGRLGWFVEWCWWPWGPVVGWYLAIQTTDRTDKMRTNSKQEVLLGCEEVLRLFEARNKVR